MNKDIEPTIHAQKLVGDLFRPNPRIYWMDFLITMALVYAGLYVCLTSSQVAWQIISGAVAALALFRAGTFIHEIAHFRPGSMRPFCAAWNILYALPMMMPSLMYRNHRDHHSKKTFGTAKDGEYLPLGLGRPWLVVLYLLQVPLLPFLALIRFGLLVPLSFLRPSWRRLLLEYASSYGINPFYKRQLGRDEPYRLWALADIACCILFWSLAVVFLAGWLPWSVLLKFYCVVVVAVGLNWVRNLAAHRYIEPGRPVPWLEQMRDSINIVGGGWVTTLLFPVGLRYHAVHHLFPAIPYHHLAEAHRRLMTNLPSDTGYAAVNYPTFGSVLRNLWRQTKAGQADAVGHWRQAAE
jgi:fatty acid desaturase